MMLVLIVGVGFFIALQSYAVDKSLSQHERLFASVITGREMKTKWRSKASVVVHVELLGTEGILMS